MESYDQLLLKLKERAEKFALHLGDLTSLNNAAREKTEALRKALQGLHGSAITCTVCMTNNSTHALIGCGHTFCRECTERAMARNPPRCFICRARVESSVRIYV